MARIAGRTVAAALVGLVAGAAWFLLLYNLYEPLRIDFDADASRLISGVYAAERDPVQGVTFAWTGGRLTLRVPGLDRRLPWTVTFRVRGARPGGSGNPEIAVAADGLPIGTLATATDFQTIEAAIPASPGRRGLTLTADVSSTFTPGGGDPRALGVMLDWIRLAPSGVVVPPREAIAGTALAAAAFGAAFSLLGITAGSAVGGTILLAAGLAAVVARGGGPYTGLPDTAAALSAGLALVLVLVTGGLRLRQGRPLRNTTKFVAAFSAAAAAIKLLILLHPDTPIGDALFQAHRFQEVLAGHVYFTSIAPGGYRFPYAPGLYVAAAPFAWLVPRGPADMGLLRTVVVLVDGLAAIALYGALARGRGDRLAGALAVALYLLTPLDFEVVRTGNLTNAFAQSLSVVALAAMASVDLRFDRRSALTGFGVVLAAAFLSHTSTFALLAAAGLLTAHLFYWHGGAALRPSGTAIGITVAAAILLAVALYYGHFLDTYRAEFARISGETAAAAPDAGGRGILARLAAVPRYLRIYYGVPLLALAAYGVAVLAGQHRRDRLALALAGWGAACVAVLALGVLTPVDMRYYLAAIPAVAAAAAIGGACAWQQGTRARAATAALLAWAALDGLRGWWSTFA
jgi:hypothetical protein